MSEKRRATSCTESEAGVATSKRNSRSDETYAHTKIKTITMHFLRTSINMHRKGGEIILRVEEGSARRRLSSRSGRIWCRKEVGKLKLKKRSIRLSE